MPDKERHAEYQDQKGDQRDGVDSPFWRSCLYRDDLRCFFDLLVLGWHPVRIVLRNIFLQIFTLVVIVNAHLRNPLCFEL